MTVVAIAGVAEAQTRERAGLIGGISLGGGTVGFGGSTGDPAVAMIRQADDLGADLAVNLYLGGMTSSRMAVLFEAALSAGNPNTLLEGDARIGARRVTFAASSSTVRALVLSGAVQYWVVPRVWVRGGVGAGSLQRDLEVKDADLMITLDRSGGVAALGAAGVELWRSGHFTVDAQFHFTTFAVEGLRVNAPSVHVGLLWD